MLSGSCEGRGASQLRGAGVVEREGTHHELRAAGLVAVRETELREAGATPSGEVGLTFDRSLTSRRSRPV